MGFRYMSSFNLALLTKQAWRLTHCLELLISRIFKARYFPHLDFLLAEIGDRPSLTWRSIISTKPHLEEGLRRRIGRAHNSDLGYGLAGLGRT